MLTSYQKKLLAAFSKWVAVFCAPDDYFCLSIKGKEYFFNFNFPLKAEDKPQRIFQKDIHGARFVLSVAENRYRHKHFLNSDMLSCFHISDITIFEPAIFFEQRSLQREDKQWLLKTAREVLAYVIEHGDSHEYTPQKISSFRLLKNRNIGVAFWLQGRLQGSQIIFGQHLYEGIVEAVERTVYDARFNSLRVSDLNEVRIELAIFDNFYVPIDDEVLKNVSTTFNLNPQNGYVMREKLTEKEGYFLPEIFNVLSFATTQDFFKKLAYAKLNRSSLSECESFSFSVETFMEAIEPCGAPVVLHGPVPERENTNQEREEGGGAMLATQAGHWLLSLQGEDGRIPPFVDPISGVTNQADWSRSAFVCLALFIFGHSTQERVYIEGAQQLYKFLEQNFEGKCLESPFVGLVCAYMGQAAYCAEDFERSTFFLERGMHFLEKNNTFEPILYAHTALLAKQLRFVDTVYSQQFSLLAELLRKQFVLQSKKETFNVVAWAELGNVFWGEDRALVTNVMDIIQKHQLDDGSFFMGQQNKVLASAKGAAKLFEVLSLLDDTNEKRERALAWLSVMQYSDENMYHIPPSIRENFLGGFRESCFDRHAWTDTVGHILIGEARQHNRSHKLLSAEKMETALSV